MTDILNEKLLKSYYTDQILQDLESNKTLIPYFVTMNFSSWYPSKERSQILRSDGISKLRSYHRKAYMYVVSNCMNNFTRKHAKHPKVYSFVDFEGTKECPNRIITFPKNPHLHDIWLVPESINRPFTYMQMECFKDVVNDKANPYLREVHALLIKDPEADMERLVSYAGKFASNPQGQQLQAKGVGLFDQLPPARSERKERRQPDRNQRRLRFHDDPVGTYRRQQKLKIREFYRTYGVLEGG
jgi:hypothetical protein